jgi:hypothetical protein
MTDHNNDNYLYHYQYYYRAKLDNKILLRTV